jgi:hypothetical protein
MSSNDITFYANGNNNMQPEEQKEKLRSILGCTSKSTLSADPTTLVPASRLIQTVGPAARPSFARR